METSDKATDSLISVIIPCYNYGHFLPETLNSVLHQTYKSWECIIVDDGSTDNTQEVCKRFVDMDNRFRYVYQQKKGTSAAKNNGIGQASGRYVQFLDADDLIAERKFELQVPLLRDNPQISLVYSDVRYFDSNYPAKLYLYIDLTDTPWMPGISGRNEEILAPLLKGNFLVISAPFVRKEAVDKTGFFNEQLKGCEDWDFWIRCALTAGSSFQFDNRSEVLTYIRVHPTSSSSNKIMMLEEEIKMRTGLQKIDSMPTPLQPLNKHLLLYTKERLAFSLIEQGYILKGYEKVLSLVIKTKRFVYYFKNSLYWLKRYLLQTISLSHLKKNN